MLNLKGGKPLDLIRERLVKDFGRNDADFIAACHDAGVGRHTLPVYWKWKEEYVDAAFHILAANYRLPKGQKPRRNIRIAAPQ